MNINFKRLLAGLIDFYLVVFLSSALILIITLGEMTISVFTVCLYLFTFSILITIKDLLFNGASLGKKILKIRLAKLDGSNFNLIDSFKRTVTIVLLPIEIFLLIKNNKRLGDVWAKTTVVTNCT